MKLKELLSRCEVLAQTYSHLLKVFPNILKLFGKIPRMFVLSFNMVGFLSFKIGLMAGK